MSAPAARRIRIAPGAGAETSMTHAVEAAAETLKLGGVILCPTDTIYGLSCLAGREEAIRRIYRIKGRPETRPALVLAGSIELATALVTGVPPPASRLMERFWPGPLTIVLRAAPGVSALLTAGTGTIGIRLPADEFCRRLGLRCGEPILSTSANRSGTPPAAGLEELAREFEGEVDLVVDAGERRSAPSTLVDLTGGTPVIVREGAIPGERVLREAGPTGGE